MLKTPEEKRMRIGAVQKKILLLLMGGLALGLAGSPKRYFRIVREIGREWKEIDRRQIKESVRALYRSKLVKREYHGDGSVTLVLTLEGRNLDGKWRMVLFDIPEVAKKERDAFSFNMKKMGFYTYQKSVFVHPSDCRKEVEFLIEHHGVRPYARFVIADSL